ncbi:hypothetical protein [Clostridium sp. BJN0001]|uniref:hypothetical protein n=1 Tax=Clostridium sp. BJN0001 TaxID=2930219 RepID=UPI001FD2FFBF|nr:hypothetical protein [Clostridium sp. BJN0001]
MIRRNRFIAASLSVMTAVSLINPFLKVYAAAPTVTADESVYANLDYYGSISDMNIVKSCSLNGNTEFTDYGDYAKVVNMSNYAEPDIDDDKVTWNLEGEDLKKRFYYECTPKSNDVEFPWTFDISYKLNGVPAKAEDLAGASGEIEMSVKAVPNEDAQDYYKNNMILQVATMIDMENTLSVEAEGSQLQSIGSYKAVVFAALPGEENTFTIRIGTNDFKSSGLVMMMIPGTLERIKDIKDLKEKKDKVDDSADAINESLNEILNVMSSMSTGINTASKGLDELNDTRGYISSEKGNVYNNVDISLDDIDKLVDQINKYYPELKNSEQMVNDLNSNINDLVGSVINLKSDLSSYKSDINKIQRLLKRYQTIINDTNKEQDDRDDAIDDLKDALGDFKGDLSDLGDNVGKSNTSIGQTKQSVEDLIKKKAEAEALSKLPTNAPDAVKEAYKNVADKAAEEKIKPVENAVSPALENLTSTNTKISSSLDSGKDLASSIEDVIDVGEDYCENIDKALDNTDNMIDKLNDVNKTLKISIDKVQDSIDNLDTLNQTADSYKDNTINVIKESENLINKFSDSMFDLKFALKSAENTMQNAGNKLDPATKSTLDGLIDILDKSLDAVGTSDSIKNAKDTIKDAIDSEEKKYEDDTNTLNMDAEHPLESFTSDKNPEPSSIQIILRTQEINKDAVKDNSEDLEYKDKNIGILQRIGNIFKRIYHAVVGE